MNRNGFTSWVNYQKVVLSVHHLAEDDGLLCHASTDELAADSGLSAPTVRKHVRRMRENLVVFRANFPDRSEGRPLVLIDHPDAARYLEWYWDYFGPLSRQVELNRERREARGDDAESRKDAPARDDADAPKASRRKGSPGVSS